MELIHYGETFKRHAYIGKHDNESTYFVSFTDWPERFGGGAENITLTEAKALALAFTLGCQYRFDKEVGIILECMEQY